MGNKTAFVGAGNTLLKDEGVGVKIAAELESEGFMSGEIEYVDVGTKPLSLLPLLEKYGRVILADAARGGGPGGSIYTRNAAELAELGDAKYSLHSVGIAEEIELFKALYGKKAEFLIIGIEPFEIGPGMELSGQMQSIFPEIIARVKEIIRSRLN